VFPPPTHVQFSQVTCLALKGSVKEGRLQQKCDLKPDPSENEDLHVLVEAETHDALEKVVGMVEKLLMPVDEGLNEHKQGTIERTCGVEWDDTR
jgi:hypothetical protein